MHTFKVIAGGFAVLAFGLLIGRLVGGPTPTIGSSRGALVFVPLWLIASAINLWIGTSKAGYSVAEEMPVFAMVFAFPTAVALLVWWRLSQS